MSEQSKAGAEVIQPQPTQQQRACSKCGHTAIALTVLDSRNGKGYRLYRCDPCKSLAWVEE